MHLAVVDVRPPDAGAKHRAMHGRADPTSPRRALSTGAWIVAGLHPMRQAFALASLLLLAVPFASAGPANTSASALDLAYAASAPGVSIVSASFMVGGPPIGASGPTATDDDANAGMPSSGLLHAVMSSGQAACIDETVSFEGCSGSGSGVSYHGANDVVVLQVQVEVPTGHDHLGIEFVFLSEEWPSFVGSPYGDAFVAELDSHTWSASGSLSAPDNFATDQYGQALTLNTAGPNMSAANAAGTAFGGATCRVTNWVAAAPGVHTLYFSIMDRGDWIYDSAILIDGVRTAQHDVRPAPACTTGAMVEGGDNAPPPPQPTTVADEVKVGDGQTSASAAYNVTVQPDGSVSAEASCHVKALGVHVKPSTCKAET